VGSPKGRGARRPTCAKGAAIATHQSIVLPPGAVRILLAVAVVVSHVSRFDIGRLAVALFFLLSGYWITSLWERQGGVRRLPLFFLNRFLRIWPLYIVAALLAGLLRGTDLPLTSYTLIGVASTPGPKPLGVEWSLDVEAQFYLLLPLIAAVRPVALLVLPFAAGWWLYGAYGIVTVAMYLPAFAIGMLLYRRRAAPLRIGPLVSLFAFSALTAVLAALPQTRGMLWGDGPQIMNVDLFAMLWMLPLVPYIAASLRRPSPPLDRHLGAFSYPLYLVHEPVIRHGVDHGWPKPLWLVAGLALALLFYLLLDIPVEKARYRVLERLQRRLAAGAG
jgi:peptidoglycan/LPS O-acetylase OafA/YrhL